MDLITMVSMYLLGIVTGALGIVALFLYLGDKSLKEKEYKAATKPSSKLTVSERMKKVKSITDEQLELAQQADGPQKNALHGRYKNGISAQIKKLEEEKNQILSSIIEDGLDPEITTIDASGTISKMKLSEYMAYMGIKMQPKVNTEQKSKLERMGKFTVVKGGKDDSGNNTTH